MSDVAQPATVRTVDVPSLKLTVRPLKNCGWKTIFLLGTSILGAILNCSFNRQGIPYASNRIFIHIYFVVMTVSCFFGSPNTWQLSDLQVTLEKWMTRNWWLEYETRDPQISTEMAPPWHTYILHLQFNTLILLGSLTNPPLKNDARKTILSVLGCVNFSGANCQSSGRVKL